MRSRSGFQACLKTTDRQFIKHKKPAGAGPAGFRSLPQEDSYSMDGTSERPDRKTVFEFAQRYVAGGISVIPIRLDGSKAPAVALWKPYQTRIATDDELRHWFLGSDHGIGICCGAVSGGLEVIDFDDGSLFEPWRLLVPDIVAALTIVQTPSDGWHVIYRCSEIGGNAKIAMDPDREKKTLIESRGEGGYVVAWGSPATAHPTGRPYVKNAGLHPWTPWKISPEDRRRLWSAARTFNKDSELVKQAKRQIERKLNPVAIATGSNPIIAKFNAKHPISDILQRHGWTSRDGLAWTRPGKTTGTSASIVQAQDGTELVRIFSSSTSLPTQSLNAFELVKQLEHGGDNRAAYKAAAEAVA